MLAVFLPVLLIPFIVVLPVVFVELLHRLQQTVLLIAFLWIPHDHHLLVLLEVHLRHPSVVEENVAEVSAVGERRFFLEADQVLSEVVSLEEDGRVVLEVEVEERNHLSITITLKVGERFLPELKHNIAVVLEEDFRRGVLPFLSHLLYDIVHTHIDVMQCSLGLQGES